MENFAKVAQFGRFVSPHTAGNVTRCRDAKVRLLGGLALRGIDYVVAVALVAALALALASMVGVPLGPADPAQLMTRALDPLAPG